VTFRDVVKTYHPDIRALNHVSSTSSAARPWRCSARTGPGSPRPSTPCWPAHATSGEVLVLGSRPAAAVAAGQIGGMLQTGGLPEGAKVAELIGLFRQLYGDPRRRARLVEDSQAGRRTGEANLTRWVGADSCSPGRCPFSEAGQAHTARPRPRVRRTAGGTADQPRPPSRPPAGRRSAACRRSAGGDRRRGPAAQHQDLSRSRRAAGPAWCRGRGLSRPRSAEQRHGLAALDVEGYVIQCSNVRVVGLDDVAERHRRHPGPDRFRCHASR